MERSQKKQILQDLEAKLVFLTGPRQVGKTWLAKQIMESYSNPVYLNYDRYEDRQIMKDEGWLSSTDLLVLDEVHKMPMWKNYIKGIYDTKSDQLHVLVTGSARLNLFRQTGDSMAGRFFLHRLLPVSLKELIEIGKQPEFDKLFLHGGFPEPFLANSINDVRRWRHLYVDSLIRTDVFDFGGIQDLKNIQLVFEMLQNRVGSPVSYTSIAEDLHIAPNTVKKYIEILESLYIVFRVTPYSRHIARSLIKEPKLYFYDIGLVRNGDGAKLENLVAVHLLKEALLREDQTGVQYHLHTLRTKEKKEVDFCWVKNNAPEKLIEVKTSDSNVHPALAYFNKKYAIPAVQIVKELKRERVSGHIEIRHLTRFLCDLETQL